MAVRTTKELVDMMARDCIAVRLRRLNRVISSFYDAALRPLGVKVSQMNILLVTAKLGLAHPNRVCELLQLDSSTLSRNVERMRARRWLEVVRSQDARAQPFRLTAAGERLLQKAAPLWEQAQQEAAALLGKEGVEWLSNLTHRLVT
jgi:DNA-binding MarR family transcriptional regulator